MKMTHASNHLLHLVEHLTQLEVTFLMFNIWIDQYLKQYCIKCGRKFEHEARFNSFVNYLSKVDGCWVLLEAANWTTQIKIKFVKLFDVHCKITLTQYVTIAFFPSWNDWTVTHGFTKVHYLIHYFSQTDIFFVHLLPIQLYGL